MTAHDLLELLAVARQTEQRSKPGEHETTYATAVCDLLAYLTTGETTPLLAMTLQVQGERETCGHCNGGGLALVSSGAMVRWPMRHCTPCDGRGTVQRAAVPS